ncbi:MAG: GNAT family N-acetyltransferase [Pseudomonadota bacterium]
MTLTLETPRLILRRPDARDAEGYIGFLGDPRSSMAGGVLERPLAWRAYAAILGHWELCGFGLFATTLRDTGETIGLIGNYGPDGWPEREIGWVLFTDRFEGTGLAYEAAVAAHRHTFQTMGWDTAVSYIAHGNDRSVALAKRLGATEDPEAETPGGKPCHVYRHTADALGDAP